MFISKKILIVALLTTPAFFIYSEDQKSLEQTLADNKKDNTLYNKYASMVEPFCNPAGLAAVATTAAIVGLPALIVAGTAVVVYEKQDEVVAALEPVTINLKQFSKDFRKHNENKPVIAAFYQGSDWIAANIEQLSQKFEEHKKQLKEKLEKSEK